MAAFRPARFFAWANTSLNDAASLTYPCLLTSVVLAQFVPLWAHHLTPLSQWRRSRKSLTTRLYLEAARPPSH